jgi:hypothetical protein
MIIQHGEVELMEGNISKPMRTKRSMRKRLATNSTAGRRLAIGASFLLLQKRARIAKREAALRKRISDT